jgi:hypothetical protein
VKATVPVGLIEPLTVGVTVAVNVTFWLTAAEGSDETTVVVVPVFPTVCEYVLEVLPVKFPLELV